MACTTLHMCWYERSKLHPPLFTGQNPNEYPLGLLFQCKLSGKRMTGVIIGEDKCAVLTATHIVSSRKLHELLWSLERTFRSIVQNETAGTMVKPKLLPHGFWNNAKNLRYLQKETHPTEYRANHKRIQLARALSWSIHHAILNDWCLDCTLDQ